MKIGRNDPCHCGSGKKYKKCCLAKDEGAEKERRKVETPVPRATPRAELAPLPSLSHPSFIEMPPDPHQEALYALWEAFSAASYDEQVALFEGTLEEQTLMDGENAFEMLSNLYEPMLERGEARRYADFILRLRTELPEIWQQERIYLLPPLMDGLLFAGDEDTIRTLLPEVQALYKEDRNLYEAVTDALAYHGKLELLIDLETRLLEQYTAEVAKKALAKADTAAAPAEPEDDEALDDEAYDDDFGDEDYDEDYAHDSLEDERSRFANALAHHLLLQQLERQPIGDEAAYKAALEQRGLSAQGDLAFCLPYMTGEQQPSSNAKDYRTNKKTDEATLAALASLSYSFLGHLHRQGMPLSRAELVRSALFQYFVTHKVNVPLQPEKVSLSPFLRYDLSGSFSSRAGVAVAVLSAIPTWLRYLEAQGLRDKPAEGTLKALEPVRDELLARSGLYKEALLSAWPEA